MNSRRLKVPWSPGDKLLMSVLGLVLPLALGLIFWFRALDQNPNVTIPTPTMPTPNARDYYIAALGAVVDDGKVGNAVGSWNPATKPVGDMHFYSLADKEKLVAENAGVIQTLHTGFSYPYQELPSRSFNADFPQYQKIRGLARLLSLKAQVDADKGDIDGAMNASLDAIQMGEQLPHGGPLIGMLVGIACQAIGRKQAWKAADQLSAAQARTAARRLETIRAGHVPFADTLQEEEWETQAGLLELMRRPDWSGALVNYTTPDPNGGQNGGQSGNSFGQWAMGTGIRLTGKRAIMANYTRYMNRSIADAHQPYAAHIAPPPLPTDSVNQMLLPIFARVRLDEVKDDTQNALLLATLALRAYRLDHGAYPPRLAALSPQYLKAVPTDPFALSGPLRYKRTGAKYLLYSVGPDGKDDGGTAIFDRTLPAPTTAEGFDRRRLVNENSRGDIVAGVNVS